MGLDGGTKITRSDVLRGQSWRMAQADGSRSTRGGCVSSTYQERQLDPQTRRAIQWSCCALSGLPLSIGAPIVADLLGQLMDRQAVLEHLLAAKGADLDDEAAQLRYSNQQRAAGGAFDHLRSLKDVFTVNLTPNPELQQQQPTAAAAAGHAAVAASGGTHALQDGSRGVSAAAAVDVPRWVCPVTLLPCGGRQLFSALKPCGHILSDKALAAISAADRTCPVCGKAFGSRDVVQINGSPEHVEAVRQQLKAKAAAKVAAKEAKAAEQAGSQRKRAHEVLEQGGSGHTCAIEAAPKVQQLSPAAGGLRLTSSSHGGDRNAAAVARQQQLALGQQTRPQKVARLPS